MVSSGWGIVPEYRGVTGTPPASNGPSWALGEKERGARRVAPPRVFELDKGEGARPPFLFPSPPPPPSPFPLHEKGKKGGRILLGVES